MYSSDSKNGSLALNAVEDACVIDGHVLLGDDLDDFLSYHATSQRTDVVELGSTGANTGRWSVTLKSTARKGLTARARCWRTLSSAHHNQDSQ